MGGQISAPSPFPLAIPPPISTTTTQFMITAVSLDNSTTAHIYCANNLKVGDQALCAGLTVLTALNGQTFTVQAPTPTTLGLFNPTVNSVSAFNSANWPAIGPGMVAETGVITRLTSGPPQPALYFTDPWPYDSPSDVTPAQITRSVSSVAHPGRQIADVIIGEMVRFQRFTLTASQILNLATTPIQVLPEPQFMPNGRQGTPGVGLAYAVKNIDLKLVAGTVPFTAADLKMTQGVPANGVQLLPEISGGGIAGIMTQTVDSAMLDAVMVTPAIYQSDLIENQAIWMSAASAPTPANANSMLTVIIHYLVIQL